MLEALTQLRALGDAFDRMHGGMRADMALNASDLAALRMLVIREQSGQAVSPHDVARHLRISTASTSKLLDRLVEAGHVERHPHPHDRRARVLVLTEKSRVTFYRHFRGHLAAMRSVTDGYGDDDLATISRFMAEIARAVAAEDAEDRPEASSA